MDAMRPCSMREPLLYFLRLGTFGFGGPIWQFLEENDAPVVGLREGSWLRIEGKSTRLGGAMGARIFRRGQPPVEKRSGEDLEVAR
jgi:hypothetical protein